MTATSTLAEEQPLQQLLDTLLGRGAEDELDERLDDLAGDELEEIEEDVVDAATAARTVAELDIEIGMLADLSRSHGECVSPAPTASGLSFAP